MTRAHDPFVAAASLSTGEDEAALAALLREAGDDTFRGGRVTGQGLRLLHGICENLGMKGLSEMSPGAMWERARVHLDACAAGAEMDRDDARYAWVFGLNVEPPPRDDASDLSDGALRMGRLFQTAIDGLSPEQYAGLAIRAGDAEFAGPVDAQRLEAWRGLIAQIYGGDSAENLPPNDFWPQCRARLEAATNGQDLDESSPDVRRLLLFWQAAGIEL